MMKHINELNEELNKFLEPFGVYAKYGSDFFFYWEDNHIEYGFLTCERIDKLFHKFAVEELGLNYNVDTFILSFLHELGHSETLDEIDAEDEIYSADVKETLTDSDESCMTYFHLPVEIAATQWAVDYINEHPTEIRNLWNTIQPIIMKIYEEV